MTSFKSAIFFSSAIAMTFGLSACAQDSTEVDTVVNETIAAAPISEPVSEPVSEPAQASKTTQAEAMPVSAPAETPQTPDHTDHADGHDHSGQGDKPAVDVAFATEIAPDDFIWGKADAPVDVIIYASVVCGHCGNWFSEQWPGLKTQYLDTGKIKVAFREFVTEPQQIAVPGFMVAACAPEGQHMDLIVHQMQTQKTTFASLQDGTIPDVMIGWADLAGLEDQESLQACFAREDHIPRINQSINRAVGAGINGVPGIIIDGTLYDSSDKSSEALSAVIDSALE